MIEFKPRDASNQLTIMVLLLMPASAIPADWRIQPSLQARSSYSDNAALAPAAQAHSAWIAEIVPALSVSHDHPRLRLILDYALDLQRHSRDGQHSSQQLDGALHADALPDWLTLDASASINQQSLTPFGAQSSDSRLHPANRRSVRTSTLSPALRHRFPSLATVEFVHRRQQVASGALYHVSRYDSSLQLSGDQTGSGWNWNLSAERGLVQDAALPDVKSARTAFSLSDTLNSELAVFASAGSERYDYQASGTAPQGHFHSWGLDWTPSLRSRLKVSAGRRYFGNTYNLAGEYRWRHLYWAVDVDEDITSTHGEYLRIAPTGLSDFLDQLWASRIPDRATRQQAIKVFLLISQMLGPDGRVSFLSHRYYLQKSWRMAGVYATARSTLALSVLGNARTGQSSSAIDSPILGPDQLELTDRTRQQAIQAAWNWRLSPQESLATGISLQRAQSLQSGRHDRNAGVTLAYTRQLGRDASLSLDLRHLRHSSNFGGAYRENGLSASLSMGF